ncbi:5-oxoprolinase subunit B family protein [Marinobacterium rhizophilum]|uniref:Allophanate hydrolase subunit 1 n=1 Tax=Marinobacterium rhizophilum TaxID=420402 RepID=A0ABY5HLV4_9GAMM|nr:allophanate hydrolase subunit 1 [Marinobacterium rhizophilum]UTW12215.1 allophanate hydrolase subunit 1 [Marinobacterium rhizophilum]
MMRIEAVGESGCMLYLGDQIDPQTSARVCRAGELIRWQLGDAIIDMVPSYASIFMSVDLTRGGVGVFCQRLEAALQDLDRVAAAPRAAGALVRIGVCYAPEVAPDMEEVMHLTGLTRDEIVELHCRERYRVYAIGFSPGFCFMGNTDARLRVPRKATPRTRVPAGSVALAERQTAVYPGESPGGWQLIGRTAVDMLALCQRDEGALQVGSQLCFEPLSLADFLAAGGQV